MRRFQYWHTEFFRRKNKEGEIVLRPENQFDLPGMRNALMSEMAKLFQRGYQMMKPLTLFGLKPNQGCKVTLYHPEDDILISIWCYEYIAPTVEAIGRGEGAYRSDHKAPTHKCS